MLGDVVTQNANTAQIFFLIGAVVAIVTTSVCIVRGAVEPALLAAAVAFIALGRLFFA